MVKGIGHAAFNVKDMDKTIEFYEKTLGFKKAFEIQKPETGAPQDDAPKQGADYNWQCWTHDPDGVKIELMQLSSESPQMKFIESIGQG